MRSKIVAYQKFVSNFAGYLLELPTKGDRLAVLCIYI